MCRDGLGVARAHHHFFFFKYPQKGFRYFWLHVAQECPWEKKGLLTSANIET